MRESMKSFQAENLLVDSLERRIGIAACSANVGKSPQRIIAGQQPILTKKNLSNLAHQQHEVKPGNHVFYQDIASSGNLVLYEAW